MFQSKLASSSHFSLRKLGNLFVIFAVTLAVAALTEPDAAPADAKPHKRKNGIDYTKPFIDDRVPLPMERSPDTSTTGRLSALSIEGLLENGNPDQAIRDIESVIRRGGLTDAEKAHNYFLLSRLYLAITPPDFKKAVEYRRKYNEITENLDQDKGR